ncbi:MAG: dihydroneopterin aldolase [Candidatus Limnocylindria bacterium]
MPQADRLTLTGMVFRARHGVLPEEHVEPQRFVVDVELSVDAAAVAARDEVSAAVDYREVFEAVRGLVEDASHRLIETLAESIAGELLRRFPVEEVEVRVRKPDAPLPGPFDHVEIAIRRPVSR